MLSNYCSNIANEYGIKIDGVNRLVPNLGNKILKFKQSDWLKKYIDINTDKRKNATNILGKNYFKLMNNSVFGKTMENLRKRTNVELVNNAKDNVRSISKPSFVSQKIFSKKFLLFMK